MRFGCLASEPANASKLKDARDAIVATFEVFMRAGQEHRRADFEARLGGIDRKIAGLPQCPGI